MLSVVLQKMARFLLVTFLVPVESRMWKHLQESGYLSAKRQHYLLIGPRVIHVLAAPRTPLAPPKNRCPATRKVRQLRMQKSAIAD
jgi:hypothetical protein